MDSVQQSGFKAGDESKFLQALDFASSFLCGFLKKIVSIEIPSLINPELFHKIVCLLDIQCSITFEVQFFKNKNSELFISSYRQKRTHHGPQYQHVCETLFFKKNSGLLFCECLHL